MLLALKLAQAAEAVARTPPMSQLQAAKARSDARRYAEKEHILHTLMVERPGEFKVDSSDRGIAGITHVPSGFRIHVPRRAVPLALWENKAAR